jgi:hypothetical protein
MLVFSAFLIMLSLGCSRETPQYLTNLRIETQLPQNIKADVTYASKEVILYNQSSTHKFVTDAAGALVVPELIPDVYTINTCWELTGEQYKELVSEPIYLEDKAKVLITATLTNVPVYTDDDLVILLESIILKDLVISKVYYSGTKDDMNRNYTIDQFVEIFNNSDDTVYVDGKYIALAESKSPPAFLASDNPSYIYTRQICRFPGSGTDHPVYPGKSIVIAARSARDHTTSAAKSVDLSQADFEVKDSDGVGNPAIKALPMYSSSTSLNFFNLITGGPNGVFLFETDENVLEWPEFYTPGSSTGERFRRVPVETVIDGVEILKNEAANGPNIDLKRLQNSIDAGFTFISATSGYVNESVERKVCKIGDGRVYLQDTNNSIEDFTLISAPKPKDYDNPQLLNLQ